MITTKSPIGVAVVLKCFSDYIFLDIASRNSNVLTLASKFYGNLLIKLYYTPLFESCARPKIVMSITHVL